MRPNECLNFYGNDLHLLLFFLSQLSSNFHAYIQNRNSTAIDCCSLPISPSVFVREYTSPFTAHYEKNIQLVHCTHILLATCFSCLSQTPSLTPYVCLFFVIVVDSINIIRFIQFLKFNFRFNFIPLFFIYFYVCINKSIHPYGGVGRIE